MKVRCIKIDAQYREASYCDMSLEDMQKHVGGYIEKVATVGRGRLPFPSAADVFADEEALLKSPHAPYGFTLADTISVVGNGIISCCNLDTGDPIDCWVSLDKARETIRWDDLTGVTRMVPPPRMYFT